MHGIVWPPNKTPEGKTISKRWLYAEIESMWKFGHIWPREPKDRESTYVNEKTVAYTVKYVSKKDIKHKHYKSLILTSNGIGHNYTKTHDSKKNKFNEEDTKDTYRTTTGHKISLPIYWRNKIYTEDEREKLWIHKLNKNERWVGGEKIKADDTVSYESLVTHYRRLSKQLGYGNDEKNYEQEEYERNRREIMQKTRIAKGKRAINTNGTK